MNLSWYFTDAPPERPTTWRQWWMQWLEYRRAERAAWQETNAAHAVHQMLVDDEMQRFRDAR